MTFSESIHFLENLRKFGDEPGLHRMEKMLSAVNNPHKKLKYVHITGTNGKGSTAASVASILMASGYKTGLFTSPHLHSYNERIKVNNVNISEADFIEKLEQIQGILEKNTGIKPALFEAMTVMAFLYFAQKKVDIAVLEVGIGGRVDSTNVIDGLVSVITNIDLEHTEVLGETKKEIALEKAGIIKLNASVITGDQDSEVLSVLQEQAQKMKAHFIPFSYKDLRVVEQNTTGQTFDFKDYKNIKIPLIGQHQLSNASLAILVAEALRKKGFEKINEEKIKKGLLNVKWPLRLEIVRQNPNILIDVGHNLHGIKAIKETIESTFKNKKRILILGCSYNKPYSEMTKILSELSNLIILTKAQYHGVEPDEMLKNIQEKGKTIYKTDTVYEALMEAKKRMETDTLIMVLGGLYLGAEAKEHLNKVFGV